MDDLEPPAEVRVLVPDRVEAVGAVDHDLPGSDLGQRLDVLPGQLLVEVLVADATGRVAVAQLPRPQDGEGYAGSLEHPDDGLADLPRPVVERSGTAHPVQVLGGLAVLEHWHLEALGPVGPGGLWLPPGV